MAKVSIPERGQPLDVAYLSTLANAINEIGESAVYNYTTIDTTSGKQNIRTSETRIIGGYYTVASNSTVTASTTKPFTYTFPNDFKYTPIVTVSPVNAGKTSAGENVAIVITDITRSGVSGLVRFNTSGNVSIIVNIIAIGIPN